MEDSPMRPFLIPSRRRPWTNITTAARSRRPPFYTLSIGRALC